MVLRFIIPATVLICGLFTTASWLIISRPYDDRRLFHLLDLAADCPVPCWQGIYPGETTVRESLFILNRHDWVTDVRGTAGLDLATNHPAEGRLSWEWHLADWEQIAPGGGWLDISGGRVRAVRMLTDLTFGDLWLLLGTPDRGSARLSRAYQNRFVVHLAIYRDHGLMLRSIIPHPVRAWGYWHAPVEIVIPARLLDEPRYVAPCWLACPPLA
jgi:hypothetical protein